MDRLQARKEGFFLVIYVYMSNRELSRMSLKELVFNCFEEEVSTNSMFINSLLIILECYNESDTNKIKDNLSI